MVDYSEGCIALQEKSKQLYDLLLNKEFSKARILCAEISTEARLIDKQIVIQYPEETGHEKMKITNVWNSNDA